MTIERLGFLRLSAIGDVVHAMPLAMALRRAYPDAHITWVTQPMAAPLLEGHPAVDDVLLFPRPGGLGQIWRFWRALRKKRFDATVDPQGNLKSGMIGWASGAAIRTGLARDECREPFNAHLTTRQGEPARSPHGVDRAWPAGGPLGVAPGPDDYGLRVTDEEVAAWHARCRAAGADPERPLFAFNLMDPDDLRSWLPDQWVAAAHAAAARGHQVILNGMAAQQPLAARMAGPGIFDLTGKDDLRGLLAQLHDMAARPGNVLLSPDSGPLHMAVAVGLRVLCMSGPQDPARTGPRKGEVITAWEGLDCAPCRKRRCVRTPPDRACMVNLDPERVVERLCAIAGGRGAAPRP